MPTDMGTIPPQPTLHHEGGGGDPIRPSGTTMGGTGVGVMARHSIINLVNHSWSESGNPFIVTRSNVSDPALHLLVNQCTMWNHMQSFALFVRVPT